jgi:hypothetical protein
MKCNCCNIDKEDKNFQTYWHSSQNKFRTRKECTECLYKKRKENKLNRISIPTEIVQPVVPESQPEPINLNLYECKICMEDKTLNEFYLSNGKPVELVCKICEVERNRKARQEYLKENCGSEFVWSDVGKYADEYQKECTFNLLKQLGYLYDEETGIWTKEGWKEIKDGQPHFPKITYKRGRKRITQQEKDKIKKLYAEGYTVDDISIQLRMSDTSVYRYAKD